MQRFRAPAALLCDEACTVVRDAVVDVGGDGRIAYVGPYSSAPAVEGPERMLSGILLPGLVNTHAHSAMTLLRGVGGDLPLDRWLREAMFPAEVRMTAHDIFDGTLLGAVEMLLHGITTSTEMYFEVDAQAEAFLQAGARAVLAGVVMDGLPSKTWQEMTDGIGRVIDERGLRYGDHERIELAYGPHSSYLLPSEALSEIGAQARRRGALVHLHTAETIGEDAAIRTTHGSVPRLLETLGLTAGRLLVAHSVHVDADDIALYARHSVGVAHCPSSNAKLASGVMPLVDMLQAGVPVGLGTDGPASNDSLDLLAEARTAALFARSSSLNAAAVTARQALLLATRGGAAALGRSDIGALEAGRWADLVHVAVDSPAFATGLEVPDEQLVANLLWAAGSRGVTDVWVAGRVVVSDGEAVLTNRRKAQAQVGEAAARLRRDVAAD
ncbi:ethylammeline chlorohydrolase [Virgisporangium aliadipatigenens]|uniref:Ethylammeline chlorohydrolase n=1 Tax=Virgisporangium aliadipatigenens TaxID=741659 RepID=A0A8J3YII9_9ACTN|nr:amidohydrolase [Virgisporangium aliadipatigenens]GIJ45062.1 ethylammeline chlorohydrolase [Virgisporangium aliadipatigenens]